MAVSGYRARLERAMLFHLEAFDWNCPQHITPRFTEAEIAQAVAPLHERLAGLEAENQAVRTRLAALDPEAEGLAGPGLKATAGSGWLRPQLAQAPVGRGRR